MSPESKIANILTDQGEQSQADSYESLDPGLCQFLIGIEKRIQEQKAWPLRPGQGIGIVRKSVDQYGLRIKHFPHDIYADHLRSTGVIPLEEIINGQQKVNGFTSDSVRLLAVMTFLSCQDRTIFRKDLPVAAKKALGNPL